MDRHSGSAAVVTAPSKTVHHPIYTQMRKIGIVERAP